MRNLGQRDALSVAVLALVSVGVGSAQAHRLPLAPNPGVDARPSALSPMSDTPTARPLSLESLVQAALLDAARVTGRRGADLRVLDAAAVDWPDGSAGCPEPDVLYTQAVVPGFRIRIQAGDAVLNYHATRHSQVPLLCPAKRVQPALPPRGGIT